MLEADSALAYTRCAAAGFDWLSGNFLAEVRGSDGQSSFPQRLQAPKQ